MQQSGKPEAFITVLSASVSQQKPGSQGVGTPLGGCVLPENRDCLMGPMSYPCHNCQKVQARRTSTFAGCPCHVNGEFSGTKSRNPTNEASDETKHRWHLHKVWPRMQQISAVMAARRR